MESGSTPFLSHKQLSVLHPEDGALLQPLQLLLLAAGDEHLPAPDAVQHKGLPLSVQLRQHVVQQEDGPLPGVLLKDLPLGQLEGEGGGAGLPWEP